MNPAAIPLKRKRLFLFSAVFTDNIPFEPTLVTLARSLSDSQNRSLWTASSGRGLGVTYGLTLILEKSLPPNGKKLAPGQRTGLVLELCLLPLAQWT